MKTRWITMAFLAAAWVWVVGGIPMVGLPAGVAEAADEEPAGKTIFLAEKCNLCHSVEAAGIEAKTKSEKLKGPDLSGGPSEDHPRELVMKYLRKQAKINDEDHKKEFKGSDEELAAIIDWLGSLEG